MNSVEVRQAEIVAEFSKFSDWEDRYKKIIEMGKHLPDLPESLRIEKNIVKGCQSQVWLHASLDPQGNVLLVGDSDALLVKGLVALLLKVYSNSPPEEILKTPPSFLKELGFESNLSPSRSNGLHAMIKQIMLFATAFSLLKKSQGK